MKAVLLAMAAVLGLAGPAGAQPAWPPARELQLVVPFEPGGNMGNLARQLADAMAPLLPHAAIVVYRSGADGNIGTSSVARAEPDGRTILLTGSSIVMSPLLHTDAGYDLQKDLEPVARIAVAPNVLIVHESLKGLSLEQILRRRGNGTGSIAFASSGQGGTSHMAAELFMAQTGVRWLHVPYKGTGPAVRAVIAGEVQAMFVPAGAVPGAVATGRVVPMAVADTSRLASLPDVPTLAELGVRGAEYSQWYGVFAPAKVPQPILAQLSALVLKAAGDAQIVKRLETAGFDVAPMGRKEFAAFVSAEHQRAAMLVKKAGIKAGAN